MTFVVNYFSSLHDVLIAINNLIDSPHLTVFSIRNDNEINGFVFMMDSANKTVHVLSYNDEELLLEKMQEEFALNNADIDWRIWAMEFLIHNSSFMLCKPI